MNERLETVMHVVAVVPWEDGAAVAQALVQRHGMILSRERYRAILAESQA